MGRELEPPVIPKEEGGYNQDIALLNLSDKDVFG